MNRSADFQICPPSAVWHSVVYATRGTKSRAPSPASGKCYAGRMTLCDLPFGNQRYELALVFYPVFFHPATMNSASQNFPHHLGVLRERMLQPADYELAVYYFLEEFAGDPEFVRASDCEQMPQLVSVLRNVVSKSLGQPVELEGALVSCLREHRFVHGNARADGRVVLFFYFEDADTGLAMIIPGIRGEGEMARFHVTGGLVDPRKN